MIAQSNLVSEVLKSILEQPGMCREDFFRRFQLSGYRLNRILRQISRQLPEHTIVNDEIRGLWIIRLDTTKCQGVQWHGTSEGGYKQCENSPEFDDKCCFEHSHCENPEIVAFCRQIAYLAGPAKPSARSIGQLSFRMVKELYAELVAIQPLTRKDVNTKEHLLMVILAATRFHEWKERMRRAHRIWIPPELFRRHVASSVNPFEYSLKKYFAVLEVASDATKEQVVKAWRTLAQRYHPDTGHGDEEMMKIVNKAKERIFSMRGWNKRKKRDL